MLLLKDNKEKVVIFCFHGSGLLWWKKQFQRQTTGAWLAKTLTYIAVLWEILQCVTTDF